MTNRPVIVGTDGTDPGTAAVVWAAREAERRGRPLRIVHVFEWDWEESRYDIGNEYVDVPRQLAEAVVAVAGSRAREVAPNLPVVTDILIGHTAARLIEAADRAELTVLGHRGGGGFAGLRLGSVSQRVATHARGPVLVVRGSDEADGPVAVGVDDSAEADQVLATAFDTAVRHGCPLTVVRSFLPPLPLWLANVRAAEVPTPEQDALERDRLEEQLAPWRAKYPEVPVEVEVTHDGAASALVGASLSARMVVVGSHGRGVVRGALLGSTGLQLLHHAECPVLIARPRPETGA